MREVCFLAGICVELQLNRVEMDDRIPSPASSSSSSSVALAKHAGRLRRREVEEDGGDPAAVSCTGKSCQSCTAEVIADCVAVCCCPCAVVNLFALAFFKLPWAVARRCLGGGRRRRNRRRVEEKRKYCGGGDTEGISEKGRAEDGTSEIVVNEECSAEFMAEEVWFELYEVGHLGFGRVSFTGIPVHSKGN